MRLVINALFTLTLVALATDLAPHDANWRRMRSELAGSSAQPLLRGIFLR